VARKQGTARWADCLPTIFLYMEEIKRQIPDALFHPHHRDGRDVAFVLCSADVLSASVGSRRTPWSRRTVLGVGSCAKAESKGRRLGETIRSAFRGSGCDPAADLVRAWGSSLSMILTTSGSAAPESGLVSQPNTFFCPRQPKTISIQSVAGERNVSPAECRLRSSGRRSSAGTGLRAGFRKQSEK